MAKNDFTSTLSQLETTLDEYLVKKAPEIPKKWKELIVKVAPWITVVLMVLAVPAVLALVGIGAALSPFAFLAGPVGGLGYVFSLFLTVIAIVLEAMAIPGLFNRTRKGWQYVYWATLVGAVQNIISFNLAGLLIGTLLGLYILFQVRSYYK